MNWASKLKLWNFEMLLDLMRIPFGLYSRTMMLPLRQLLMMLKLTLMLLSMMVMLLLRMLNSRMLS